MKARAKQIDVFNRKSTPYLYLFPTLLLMLTLIVMPIIMVIGYSFFDNVIVIDSPEFVGLANYISLFQDSTFWVSIRNTAFFVGFSVLFHLILGMTFAMLLNTRYLGNLGKAVFRVIYVLPWVFTASVIAILWRLMLSPSGVLNYLLESFGLIAAQVEWLSNRQFALMSVTFVNIWAGYPFFMISILAGLQGISSDLYEASAIDGANAVQQFFRITIPQLKPILISLIMLDFVWTTQQFALIWMLTGGGPINATEMLSTFIYKQGFTRNQFAMASASAVVILLICTAAAIFYVKVQKARD
ncbi:MAG: sugar ABC transporter permease [Lachnospiraceae bacterium]|nr:sugar ABC transporter permease [Lachnospiraceae bacterium]